MLSAARAIGEELAAGGEHLLLDSVDVVSVAGPGQRAELAEGYAFYGEAAALAREREFTAAKEPLRSAVQRLEGRSPLVLRALFLDLRRRYHEYAHGEVLSRGSHLLGRLDPERHPVLYGRVSWVMATTHAALQHPGESAALYRKALEQFQRVGEVGNAVAVRTHLASALHEVGRGVEAWRHRFRALEILAQHPVPRRSRVLFGSAARAAAEIGDFEAASAYQHQAVELALAEDRPIPSTTAHLHRASLRQATGDLAGARADLEAARARAADVPGDSDRASLEAEIDLAAGSLLASSEPLRALQLLDGAEPWFRDREHPYHLPDLWRARAQAHRALGDDRAAEVDLRRALAEIERQRSRLERPRQRIGFFDRAGDAYDDLLALELDRDGADAIETLDLSDEARARTLYDWLAKLGLSRSPPKPPVLGPARSAAASMADLPAGVRLVQFEVLADRLVSWVAWHGGVELSSRRVSAEDLAALVDDLREAMVARDGPAADQRAEELFELLFEPLRRHLEAAEHLVVAADGPLHGLPFGALVDPTSQRRLIEEHRLTITPGLAALDALTRRSDVTGTSPGRVVMVEDPSFEVDTALYHLPRLPFARRETRALRTAFGDARVYLLAGEEAQPGAVLGALADAEVFHLAAHAMVQPRSPLASSVLLAPGPGADGSESRHYLYAHELLDTSCPKLRLVVLSACQTGFGGRRETHEGTVGLVWPFLARGVPSVVASLWPVADVQTAWLFESFYAELGGGAPPAEALRRAQLAQIRADAGRRPEFSWAAFQVYGAAVP